MEVGSRLGELQGLTKAATVARTRADTTWQNARLALSEAEAGLRLGHKRQIEQRAEHAKTWPSCAAPGATCRKAGAVPRAAPRWWPNTRTRTRWICASRRCSTAWRATTGSSMRP
ncbi:hypothetical protein LP420_15685 [Massilia sp. B-10]|nr:hypothetical protein LP420_15685 [Massilia sp. B-10]